MVITVFEEFSDRYFDGYVVVSACTVEYYPPLCMHGLSWIDLLNHQYPFPIQ